MSGPWRRKIGKLVYASIVTQLYRMRIRTGVLLKQMASTPVSEAKDKKGF